MKRQEGGMTKYQPFSQVKMQSKTHNIATGQRVELLGSEIYNLGTGKKADLYQKK